MDFKSGLVTVYSSKWISVGIEPFYWRQYCVNKLPVCTHNKPYMVWCSPPNCHDIAYPFEIDDFLCYFAYRLPCMISLVEGHET